MKKIFIIINFIFCIFYAGKYYTPKNLMLYEHKDIFNIDPENFKKIFGIYKSSFYKFEKGEIEKNIEERLRNLKEIRCQEGNYNIIYIINFLKFALRKIENKSKLKKALKVSKNLLNPLKKDEKLSIIQDFPPKKSKDLKKNKTNFTKKKIEKQKKITDYFNVKVKKENMEIENN